MKTINSQKRKSYPPMKPKIKKGIGFVINMINNNNDEDTKKEDIKNA